MTVRNAARGSVTLAASAAALLAVSGVGYAYWTTTGTGSGTARAADFLAPTITAGSATGQLFPGSSGGSLQVMVTNTNPFDITVTLTRDAGKPVTSDKTGCTDEGGVAATATGVSFSGGSFTVPAETTTAVSRSVASSVSMGTNSASACQGALFTIPVTSSSSTVGG